MEALAWIVLAVVVVVVPLFAYLLVRRYSDHTQSTKLTTSVTVAALSLSLLTLFLVPIDIYIVSSNVNEYGLQKDPSATSDAATAMKTIYYICYGGLVFLAFGLMPFVYFLFEEEDESSTFGQQAMGALKYTLAFIVIFGVLLVLGLVLQGGQFTHNDGTPWVDRLKGSFGAGDSVMSWCISCLALLGLFGWIMYSAYGLAAVPIFFIRNRVRPLDAGRRGSEEDSDLNLRKVQADLKFLSARYDVASRKMTDQDQKEFQRLKREERRLTTVTTTRSSNKVLDWASKVWNATHPLRIVVGIALLGVSVLLMVSFLIGAIDRAEHSKCGASCGFSLDKSHYVNPVDEALNALSKAFPADYLVYGGVVLYIFLSSLSAMVDVGVRLLCWKLYDVRPKNTMPHGLIMGVWLLMFMVLLLNVELLTLAPQYTTFGNQFTYVNATVGGHWELQKQACSAVLFGNTTQETFCVMTQLGRFVNTIETALPFFGVVFYGANYVFVASFVLFAVYSSFRTHREVDYQEMRDDYENI